MDFAHTDEDKYKNAFTFNPDRFIGSDGKLSLRSDTAVPFGAGMQKYKNRTKQNTNCMIKYTNLFNFRKKTLCWRNICKKYVILNFYGNDTEF